MLCWVFRPPHPPIADTCVMTWPHALKHLSAALLFASLAACGGGENEAANTVTSSTLARSAPITQAATSAQMPHAPTVQPLLGLWRSDCLALGDKSAILAPQISAHRSNSAAARISGSVQIYSNSSTCIGPYSSAQLAGSLRLELSKSLGNGKRVQAGQLALALQGLATQQKLLTGKNVFYLSAKGRQLFLGDSLGQVDVEGYPTTLSTDYAFWRQ